MTRKSSTDHPARGYIRVEETLEKDFPPQVWYVRDTSPNAKGTDGIPTNDKKPTSTKLFTWLLELIF